MDKFASKFTFEFIPSNINSKPTLTLTPTPTPIIYRNQKLNHEFGFGIS